MSASIRPESADRQPGVVDYVSIAALSGGALAAEIVLLRLFSYSQWHHFASLAVSLALLGFGAAATGLVILGDRARRWGDALFAAGIFVAGAGMIAVLVLNRAVAVRPLFIVWDARELGKILLLDFSAFVPFFGIGLCVGQVFVRWPKQSGVLYGANLLGSGAGALGAALLLSRASTETAWLTVAGVVLGVGAAFAGLRVFLGGELATARGTGRIGAACAVVFLLLVGWVAARGVPPLPISDFKRLAYLLDLPDAKILLRSHGFRGMSTEIRSDSIRIAPGLSLRWSRAVPATDALVLDTDRVVPLPRALPTAGLVDADYREAVLGDILYRLRPHPDVLVLGTSERLEAFHTMGRKADTLTWVESDARIVEAFARRFVLDGLVEEDPRRFLATGDERYDAVVFDAAAAPGDSLAEDSLMTVDGIDAALDRLLPGGFVVIPLQLSNPPRSFPKCVRMVREALGRKRIQNPADRVVALRSLREGVVLVSNRRLAPNDLEIARGFTDRWGFDLVWLPGMKPEEANRYSQLSEPLYYQTTESIFHETGGIPRAARLYSLRPATDAAPYFRHTMRWSTLPEAWRVLGREGLMLFDWGTIFLVVALVTAGVIGAVLILAPLGRPALLATAGTGRFFRSRAFLYFAALGIGYLSLEIAVLQRCVFLFGNAVLGAAVVFTVFLTGSGIGSLRAPEDSGKGIRRVLFVPLAVGMVVAAGVLWGASERLWRLPVTMALGVVVVAVFPVAWSMGRLLPWGLRRVGATVPPLIPWCWGVNGFVSVVAAPLATLVSVQFSQPWTWGVAAGAYAVAGLAAGRLARAV